MVLNILLLLVWYRNIGQPVAASLEMPATYDLGSDTCFVAGLLKAPRNTRYLNPLRIPEDVPYLLQEITLVEYIIVKYLAVYILVRSSEQVVSEICVAGLVPNIGWMAIRTGGRGEW